MASLWSIPILKYYPFIEACYLYFARAFILVLRHIPTFLFRQVTFILLSAPEGSGEANTSRVKPWG